MELGMTEGNVDREGLLVGKPDGRSDTEGLEEGDSEGIELGFSLGVEDG